MIDYARTIAVLWVALGVGGCGYGTYEYPAAQYIHRTQTITMSAGNAQEINAATQVIDPWKAGVGDPRYPVNGDRMVYAAQAYRAKAPAAGQGGQPGQPGSLTQPGATGTLSSGPAGPSGITGTTTP